jgi:preprotein translocase subunit SecG
MIPFFLYLTFILFIILSVFLILLVLIQKGRGGGLSGAFGGGGGNTAFGSKTGDVLTWATSIVFGLFLILGIALNRVADKYNEQRYPSAPAAGTVNNQQPAPMKTGTSSSSQPTPG